jgi:hypothetical protein
MPVVRGCGSALALGLVTRVSPAEIIDLALKRGAEKGLAGLSGWERRIYLISQAEILCDMEGVTTFLDQFETSLPEAAEAFAAVGADEIAQSLRAICAALPQRPEELLDWAGQLISSRSGYDYDTILKAISRVA